MYRKLNCYFLQKDAASGTPLDGAHTVDGVHRKLPVSGRVNGG